MCGSIGPPCQAAWKADAVFAARVLAIESADTDDPKEGAIATSRVRIRVTEALRNVGAKGVELFSDLSSCSYQFEVGGEYLIYAFRHPGDGRLRASICSRTRRLADAADDLRYLRGPARQSAPGRGRLFGTVRRLDPEADGGWRARVPVPNVLVTAVSGDRTHRARTAADGSFEMAVLAGKYTVSVDLPDELHASGPITDEVRDLRGCAEVPLIAHWNGRVSGRVVNAAGEPVPGFAVELKPVATPRDSPFLPHLKARTDAEGRYEISKVSPAEYYLGSDTWRSGPQGPDLRPGPVGVQAFLTDESSAPRVFDVGPGARIEAPDFVVPERFKLAEISGVVLGAKGAPVAGARVSAWVDADGAMDGPSSVTTDEAGRFTIAVIAGRRYRVVASLYDNQRNLSEADLRGLAVGAPLKGLVLELKPRR